MKLVLHLALCVVLFAPGFGQIPDVLLPDFEQKSSAQSHQYCSHPAALVMAGNRALVKRPYDVLEYNLWMDWRNPLKSAVAGGNDHQYSGINTITIRSDSTGLQVVLLDAASIIIDSAFLVSSGKRLSVGPLSSIKGYAIDLLAPKFKGDTFAITLYYTRIGNDNRGLYLFPKDFYVGLNRTGDSIKNLAPIAYTMSEPEDARYWMPCNDAPYDKARFEMSVTLPFNPNAEENFVASTSIQGNALITPGADFRRYTWKDTTPIPTYLVSLNASYFVNYQQWYKRFSNPNDSIPINNYVWKKDFEETETDGTKYNAKNALRRMPEMMGFLSETFVEYPFKSYGHTAIHPFAFGGMEHQTMSSINRSWLYGEESGLLHELGHQWLGDLVSCATWADIWLNEGGATFTEALWAEKNRGKNGYRNFLRGRKNGYLSSEQPAVYGIPIQNLFNYGTSYAKGAWIYAMLRYVTGDSVFFPVMRQYFRDRAYSVAETEDLLAHFEKYVPNPAVPFRTFFEQWLYKRGHPIYEASFNTTQESATEYKASLTLKQVQTGENVPEVFVMPVSLTFEGAKGETQTVTLLNNSRQQNFQIITPYPVVALYVDRDENILAVKADTVTSVEEEASAPEGGFAVMPNPVSGAGEFSVNISVHLPDSKVYIALYDMTGRIAEVIHDGIFPAGNYTIARQNNLPTGVYYVRATVDGKTFAAPLTVVK